MPYSFVQDVPADEKTYRQVRAQIGDAVPHGLVAHIVIKQDNGLRFVDVWDTEKDWERFREDPVAPALSEVFRGRGISPDPSRVVFEHIDVLDTWTGGK